MTEIGHIHPILARGATKLTSLRSGISTPGGAGDRIYRQLIITTMYATPVQLLSRIAYDTWYINSLITQTPLETSNVRRTKKCPEASVGKL